MAAGWSCLRWRSRARLGTGRSLPCSCKLMGWKGVARLRVDSTGDIPGREQSRGQGGLRREASLRGRGGPRAAHTDDTPPLPESRRDCCPWPRGDRGGKKPWSLLLFSLCDWPALLPLRQADSEGKGGRTACLFQFSPMGRPKCSLFRG